MKTCKTHATAVSGLISVFLAIVPLQIHAQQAQPLPNGYFVVVSTFKDSQSREARSYSELLNKRGFTSTFGIEASKHYVYVYLASFGYDQFAQSVDRMKAARAKDGFPTAWVLKIKDGKEIKEGESVEESNPKVVAKSPVSDEQSLVTEYIPNPTPKPIFKPQHLGNTPIFLSVIKKNNKKVLDGTVKILDVESKKVLGTVNANAYFEIPDPKSKSGDITLVASAFGFNDATQQMNYKQTERDTVNEDVTLFGNFFMLTFEMERMTSGAKTTLTGVSFFNDAAIMVPASRNQLDDLLDMLNENLKMKIRLEGHTNSNSRGNIVSVGPSKNYFALTKDRITTSGSAKSLSEARAEVIKAWLVDQGVAADRIETVGWGGSKPIYDSKSNLARKNSRVELVVVE